jgi:hypothetical protein
VLDRQGEGGWRERVPHREQCHSPGDAIIVYRAPALVVSAALIGAARQRLP